MGINYGSFKIVELIRDDAVRRNCRDGGLAPHFGLEIALRANASEGWPITYQYVKCALMFQFGLIVDVCRAGR